MPHPPSIISGFSLPFPVPTVPAFVTWIKAAASEHVPSSCTLSPVHVATLQGAPSDKWWRSRSQRRCGAQLDHKGSGDRALGSQKRREPVRSKKLWMTGARACGEGAGGEQGHLEGSACLHPPPHLSWGPSWAFVCLHVVSSMWRLQGHWIHHLLHGACPRGACSTASMTCLRNHMGSPVALECAQKKQQWLGFCIRETR